MVGFVDEDELALTAFVAGLVGWWLMQKVKKSSKEAQLAHIYEVDISLFMISLKVIKI